MAEDPPNSSTNHVVRISSRLSRPIVIHYVTIRYYHRRYYLLYVIDPCCNSLKCSRELQQGALIHCPDLYINRYIIIILRTGTKLLYNIDLLCCQNVLVCNSNPLSPVRCIHIYRYLLWRVCSVCCKMDRQDLAKYSASKNVYFGAGQLLLDHFAAQIYGSLSYATLYFAFNMFCRIYDNIHLDYRWSLNEKNDVR